MRERERGRERRSNAASRASLERPFRSPPLPKARQKRGGSSANSGEWTEVRRRRWKALRHDEEGLDRVRQNRGFQNKMQSKPGQDCSLDRCLDPNHQVDDRNRSGRSRSLYNRGMNTIHRSGKRKHTRSSSTHHRSRSASKGARRRLEMIDRRGRSKDMEKDGVSFAGTDRSKNGWEEKEGRDVAIEKGTVQGLAKQVNNRVGGEGDGGGRRRKDVALKESRPATATVNGMDKEERVDGEGVVKEASHQRKGDVMNVENNNGVGGASGSALKRNRYGQPYGFVKFFNVKNVTKLMKALNNVWFGYFRVKASVAMFDRNAFELGRNPERQKDGMETGVKVQPSKAGRQSSMRQVAPIGSVDSFKMPRQNSNCAEVLDLRAEKKGSEAPEGVQVGDIVIKLGARKEELLKKADSTKMVTRTPNEQPDNAVKERQVFQRSYHSKPDDSKWALNGVVASVVNGEAIPVLQNRIRDAGFNDLVLIPMGADKVFVRNIENTDTNATFDSAKDFFKLVFSSWTRWENETSPYRRGAWVCLYGVPIHAWNEQFFQLCVFDCGGFLRTDCCSAEKNRLDFARVLIATPELDIIKRSVTVLVDGIQVEIKVVEEWGYALGEDSCLFEEESEAESSCGEGLDDHEVNRNVDLLVNQFKEGIEVEDHNKPQGMQDEEFLDKLEANPGSAGVGTNSVLRMDSQEVVGEPVGRKDVSPHRGMQRLLLFVGRFLVSALVLVPRRRGVPLYLGLGVWSGYRIRIMGMRE
ncbi:putative sulfate transporter [Trifolium pratense]|uniref:Putative sulfate transporter n=1 Tax=Trifolium pratense TaxID=57577 RepID=A0A2K3PB11_TRIPR|nr:putative sulfate transporter [Trifolium pratense]